MSRPAKSTKTRTGHMTKDEVDLRQSVEDKLRGSSDKIIAPDWLNHGQKIVFDCILAEMIELDLLGNVDVYALTAFSVATERLFSLESEINEDVTLAQNKDLIFARNSYVKDFWRGMNELSLSPQARAKIGALNLSKKEAEEDPLKKILAGRG